MSRAGRRRFHCRTSSLEVLPHKAAVKIKNKISPTHFHQLWSKWSRWAALNELISYQNHNHCCYSSWLTRPSSLLVCVAAGVWIASDYFRCFMCHRRLLCDFWCVSNFRAHFWNKMKPGRRFSTNKLFHTDHCDELNPVWNFRSLRCSRNVFSTSSLSESSLLPALFLNLDISAVFIHKFLNVHENVWMETSPPLIYLYFLSKNENIVCMQPLFNLMKRCVSKL